ncbi:MAG TPA: oligosaccharide flippase family protein [Rhodanobacteraceae bacterium]|nr:oligosaccharide flippase family protein [Rhodanobacteraceae bacterium]
MSEIARTSIATHYLRYTIGNVLIMLAGFVSYPIMTRLLSNAQYGVLGYFDAWMLILAVVIKLGSQHSTVRFYPHTGGADAMLRYGSTFVLFSFVVSCGVWLLAVLLLAIATALGRVPQPVEAWVMLVLLLPTVCVSYVTSFLTAQERSDLSVRLSVAQRWGDVFTILGIVYFLSRTATGVYSARLISASVVAAVGAAWVLRHVPMRWRERDVKKWAEGVRYGVPMGANELAYVVLGFVDRVMLKQQLQSFVPVGIYSIGYGLALTVNSMLHAGMRVAYNQVSIRVYETEGPKAVVLTKRRVLDVLVYIVTALIVGTLVVGPDLLLLLSGHDKYRSAQVFVWVTVIYVFSGLIGLCASGLVLHKRSGTIFTITVAAAVANVLLNLSWIPAYGYMGAVYATAVCMVGLNCAQFVFCPRELRALPGARPTLIAGGLGLLFWLVAHFTGMFGLTQHLPRLIAAGLLMLVVFVVPSLALDRPLREVLHAYWKRRRAGHP